MSKAQPVDRELKDQGAAADQKLSAQPSMKTTGHDLALSGTPGATVPAPTTYNQMLEMSQLMARSESMVGKAFRGKPAACLAILQQSLRMGFDPYMMSQKAYLVGETIGYEAQLVHAILLKNAPFQRRPRFSFSGDPQTTRRCKVLFFVDGEPEPLEYESPETKDIKPKNSPLWKTDEDQQLSYYAIRAGGRRHFPEVLMGVYTPEEIQAGLVEERQGIHRETMSLREDEEVQDADFTPIDAVLNKAKPQPEPEPAKEEADAPSDVGQETGGGPESKEATKPDTATPAADAGSKPAPEPEVVSDDEALLRSIEEIPPGRALNRKRKVAEVRAELERIADTETGAPEDLKKRAAAILADYPAEKKS